jgi:hypothetical protein
MVFRFQILNSKDMKKISIRKVLDILLNINLAVLKVCGGGENRDNRKTQFHFSKKSNILNCVSVGTENFLSRLGF